MIGRQQVVPETMSGDNEWRFKYLGGFKPNIYSSEQRTHYFYSIMYCWVEVQIGSVPHANETLPSLGG